MSSTIILGKSDAALYNYAKYIYDKMFNFKGADFNKDDMIQAGIMYVWVRRDSFDPNKGKLNSWLWNNIVYGMRSERNLIRSRDIHPLKDNVSDGMDRYYDDATDVILEEMSNIERAEVFAQRVLSGEFHLPKQQMSVMVKILRDDMNQTEISIEENVSTSAVSARWSAAVAKIEQRLIQPYVKPKPRVHPKRFLFNSPDGEKVTTTSILKLAKRHGISGEGLSAVYRGKSASHAGWTRFNPIRDTI